MTAAQDAARLRALAVTQPHNSYLREMTLAGAAETESTRPAPDSADRHQADRLDAVNYTRAAQQARSFSRHYAALAVEVQPDPVMLTFAKPLAALLVRAYEQLAADMAMVADQAQECADSAREHLGVSA